MTRTRRALARDALHAPSAGLSLVETVVALTILAVLLGLSTSWGQAVIDNRRLAGTVRTIGTDIRFVEQRARAERRCWRLEFDPPGEHYHVQYLNGGTWTQAGGCSGGTWQELRQENLPRRVDLVSTTFLLNRMTVSPFGNPNGGTIVLATPGGPQRTITINILGRVVVGP